MLFFKSNYSPYIFSFIIYNALNIFDKRPNIMDINKYPNLFRFSRATLFRHANKPLDEDMYGVRLQNRGRPCLTIKRDLRVIKRQSNVMREGSRSFSVVELQRGCGMSSRMSAITFRRALNSLGYNYRNTRRKEMLLKRT